MPTAIRCTDLKKTYPGKPPVEAVRGINLEVKTGQCYGVLGPNGAGKTTTIEILEGLMEASSGTTEILGMRWGKDDHAIRNRIGVSLQETELSDRLTVRETLAMFRSFYKSGITPQQAMARVSLEEKADSWIKKLSGGQKQRLSVACALVGDPELIFLDEPTTGLDPTSRRQLWDIIRSFGQQGRTVLLSTHYMEEAERLCDRVAIFDRGKVIAEGTPLDLIRSLGAEHIIEFTIDGDPESVPLAGLQEIDTVDSVERKEDTFHLTVAAPHRVLPLLIEKLSAQQYAMSSLTTRHASLEDVFVSLTGRNIAEAEQE